jgi:hypothetical protein
MRFDRACCSMICACYALYASIYLTMLVGCSKFCACYAPCCRKLQYVLQMLCWGMLYVAAWFAIFEDILLHASGLEHVLCMLCTVLQEVAVCFCKCCAEACCMLQCGLRMLCTILQYVTTSFANAMCYVAVCCGMLWHVFACGVHYAAICCDTLWYAAVYLAHVMHYVAAYCSVFLRVVQCCVVCCDTFRACYALCCDML